MDCNVGNLLSISSKIQQLQEPLTLYKTEPTFRNEIQEHEGSK